MKEERVEEKKGGLMLPRQLRIPSVLN